MLGFSGLLCNCAGAGSPWSVTVDFDVSNDILGANIPHPCSPPSGLRLRARNSVSHQTAATTMSRGLLSILTAGSSVPKVEGVIGSHVHAHFRYIRVELISCRTSSLSLNGPLLQQHHYFICYHCVGECTSAEMVLGQPQSNSQVLVRVVRMFSRAIIADVEQQRRSRHRRRSIPFGRCYHQRGSLWCSRGA